MSHLHAMFRSLVAVGLPVDQLVERANHVFVESTIATHFATLVCGRATAHGEVEICNAGHCPPLLVRGGAITALEPTGLPIGLFADARFSSARLKLAPGDSVVLYTDGLSEAHDPAENQYGTERLVRLLGNCHRLDPHDLIGSCLKDLTEFRVSEPLRDDLTLMVVRRTG
jgi:sigma-B regulation protein RsbU (phosphoserine phosphatase)